MQEKDFSKTETKNSICINMFCYENKLTFPIYVSDQKFISHYVYIKDFQKRYFCKSCLQFFVSENVLTEHKEVCLSIHGAQFVRLEKRTIEFNNYFKQIPVPLKIYAKFDCNLGVLNLRFLLKKISKSCSL